ncbi:B12-binding domain-containing radical SAM protein [Bacillus cereus group sp. Bc253]|uniref:B12-binding domain-containing radical SAM protein n=1 Tax=Bacillus cereus group sp. Bc253 TaxID=3018103 RepID=UPI0022E28153|nr:radical SAM protein [Bacillus cereus group sp. Bc253]MDA2157690.1 radical SAM protein [Bacillus cereus group sp. Bc253]
MELQDLKIIFPPVTEARLFPYLSLPMITGYLRNKKLKVEQKDFNIELCHNIFSKTNLLKFIESYKGKELQNIKNIYRLEFAKYLYENQEELFHNVFINKKSDNELKNDVRLVRQGIELLLETSFLKKEVTSLPQMISEINMFIENQEDIGSVIQKKMLVEFLNQNPTKIFGISIAYYSQLLPSLLLCKWIKELMPEVFVTLGGQQIMLRKEQLLKLDDLSQYVDGLGTGAGEETLYLLSKHLDGEVEKHDVPDFIFLKDNVQKEIFKKSNYHIKDALPPDFSDLPYKNYLDEEVHMSIITCVGCYWGRCAFCSYGNRSRQEKNYQQKTPKQIAYECEYLIKNYGATRINFIDENTNLRLVLNAMRILNDNGYRISFSTRNRLEDILLKKEFCKELKDRGCILMSVGYETNSQRILDLLDKGVTANNYQQIIDNLHELGIPLRFSIIGGLPNETEEEVMNSEEFLKKNADKIGIDVMQMLVAEPTTYLAKNPEKYNITITSDENLRGNKLLNYGMGRMGATFNHSDGDTFNERLNRFLEIYKNVNPQKNDELPPDKRSSTESRDNLNPNSYTYILQLYPWVRVVKSERILLMDFLWQRVFPLPNAIYFDQDYLYVVEEEHQVYLQHFSDKGAGILIAVNEEEVMLNEAYRK